MMAVEGTTEFKLDQVAARIGVLFKDVIGQANVRRKRLPGLAHTLIFFGFLAVQPHSLELMIKGVCPAFEVGQLDPRPLRAVTCSRPISWHHSCWSAFAYAIYRRTMLRQTRLPDHGDRRQPDHPVHLPDHHYLPAHQRPADAVAARTRRL